MITEEYGGLRKKAFTWIAVLCFAIAPLVNNQETVIFAAIAAALIAKVWD